MGWTRLLLYQDLRPRRVDMGMGVHMSTMYMTSHYFSCNLTLLSAISGFVRGENNRLGGGGGGVDVAATVKLLDQVLHSLAGMLDLLSDGHRATNVAGAEGTERRLLML